MAMFRVRAVYLCGAMLLSMGQMMRSQEAQAKPNLVYADAQAGVAAQAAAAELAALPPCPAPPPSVKPTEATPAVGTPAVVTPTVVTPAAAAPDVAVPAVPTSAAGTIPTSAPDAAVTPADGAVPAGVGILPDGTQCRKPPAIRYDKKGRPIKEKVKKEKPPKLVPVTVVKGALTVDGLIAKADLNFQILDLQFLYIWVPGMGTAIVSNHPFSGSKMQLDALSGSIMTIKADDHQLQLAGDRDMLGGKKPKPLTLYVSVDRTYQHGSIYPEFGYGNTPKAPYNWPGTLADLSPNSKAPPLPDNLKQKTQAVKMCTKNPDGTEGACRVVEVPMSTGKKGS
jgi:hypothetical protein